MIPRLVFHADWSSDPAKRWITTAVLDRDIYQVGVPKLVGDPSVILSSAAREAADGCAVLGFDFPIGIPLAYARKANIGNFLEVLPQLGSGRWKRFYDIAACAQEISVKRPFYPLRPGGTLQAHLVQGIGVASMSDLLRRCDFGDKNRNNACALFWTLGGNQEGRAAISGWRDVLVPALGLSRTQIGVWPFHGDLSALIKPRSCVVVETYPAEVCVQLGLSIPGRGWSKRNRQDRAEQGKKLHQWAKDKAVGLEEVSPAIERGFGDSDIGEDQFDSVVGLLGMLGVVLGHRNDGAPSDDCIRTIEGWIFGQSSPMID